MKFNKKSRFIITVVIGVASFLIYQKSFSFSNGVLTFKYPTIITNLFKKINTDKPSNEEIQPSNNNSPQTPNNTIEIESNNENDEVVHIDYGFFNIDYNCSKGGFNYFAYNAVPDGTQNYERYSPFHYDQKVGQLCHYNSEQINRADNTSTYKSPKGAPYTYDRGHGNHQNIWDHNKEFMKITNYMSNIVPQESTQNRRGLWRHSEVITQCLRGNNDIYVVGGNVWGNDTSNDYFVKSHGVVTPDYLFKIIIKNNEEVFAFVIPNTPEATEDNSSNYMTSINEIEKLVGYPFNIDNSLKSIVSNKIPKKPSGCSIK